MISELKINPDNTINIHSTKKSWTREEVENLLMRAYIYGQADKSDDFTIRENWIEKTYKLKKCYEIY